MTKVINHIIGADGECKNCFKDFKIGAMARHMSKREIPDKTLASPLVNQRGKYEKIDTVTGITDTIIPRA